HGGHAIADANHGAERGAALRAYASELLRQAARAGRREREEQAALGSEPLHERRGRHAGFLRDVGQGEVRTAARDDAVGGAEDLGVAGRARPWTHGVDYK